MIQINAAARPPPKMAHGIKTNYQHRSCRDRHGRSQRGCARRRPVVRFVNASGSIQKKREHHKRQRQHAHADPNFNCHRSMRA
jgi:hypothetical protein